MEDLKVRVLILYAKPYRINDEQTGEIKEGVSCNYYMGDKLETVLNKDGSRGMRPAKCSLDIDKFSKIITAPAFYDAQFEMTVGADGKPVLKITDLEFTSTARLVCESDEVEEKAADKKAEAEAEESVPGEEKQQIRNQQIRKR